MGIALVAYDIDEGPVAAEVAHWLRIHRMSANRKSTDIESASRNLLRSRARHQVRNISQEISTRWRELALKTC
jgi:hypothetical protein